jgi:hypothetical protein
MFLLTVVPFSPKTSIGNNIRSVVASANPMEIVTVARNRSAVSACRPATYSKRQKHLPTDPALSAGLRPDAFFRGTTLLGRALSSAFGSVSFAILPSRYDTGAACNS